MKVRFTGALYDSSGYGQASRDYVKALITRPELDLALTSLSFEPWKTDFTEFKKQAFSLQQKNLIPECHIVHLTPENFPRFRNTAVRKTVGLTVWETDRIPDSWVGLCNQMNEIWTPCKWNVEVFKNSGVTCPIKYAPHCFDMEEFKTSTSDSAGLPDNNPGTFHFYSIFQWNHRKNPEGLIRAYLAEFNAADPVNLILKTYIKDNSEADKRAVEQHINAVISSMQLTSWPKITLIHGALSRKQILSMHKKYDCFVLPHRAEGFGIPIFEAMASGKPAIATGYGGNVDFMNSQNSWLVDSFITPVHSMGRSTYHGKMNWAEPNIAHLQRCMREAYASPEVRNAKAAAALETVTKFSYENVGQVLVDLLK